MSFDFISILLNESDRIRSNTANCLTVFEISSSTFEKMVRESGFYNHVKFDQTFFQILRTSTSFDRFLAGVYPLTLSSHDHLATRFKYSAIFICPPIKPIDCSSPFALAPVITTISR